MGFAKGFDTLQVRPPRQIPTRSEKISLLVKNTKSKTTARTKILKKLSRFKKILKIKDKKQEKYHIKKQIFVKT